MFKKLKEKIGEGVGASAQRSPRSDDVKNMVSKSTDVSDD